jgi:hypothetical protein
LAASKNTENMLLAWQRTRIDGIQLEVYSSDHISDRFRQCDGLPGIVKRESYSRVRTPFGIGTFLLLASYREGHPSTLVEAMLAGSVVIGSDIPGVGEHVRASGGIMIDRPLDVAAIASGLSVALGIDDGELLERSQTTQAYAERWSSADCSAWAAVSAVLSG